MDPPSRRNSRCRSRPSRRPLDRLFTEYEVCGCRVAALVERGIDDGRIVADGRGLTEPVASNDTDEGRARNRRVEVLIVGVEPPESDG